MAMIRSKGGVVLNKYLVARVFAFDDCTTRGPASGSATSRPLLQEAIMFAVYRSLRTAIPLRWAAAWGLLCTAPPRPASCGGSRAVIDLFGLGSGIRKTQFSPDGSLLAVVGRNSNVALYDVATATRRLVPRRAPPS